jgi:hypothetical protein
MELVKVNETFILKETCFPRDMAVYGKHWEEGNKVRLISQKRYEEILALLPHLKALEEVEDKYLDPAREQFHLVTGQAYR